MELKVIAEKIKQNKRPEDYGDTKQLKILNEHLLEIAKIPPKYILTMTKSELRQLAGDYIQLEAGRQNLESMQQSILEFQNEMKSIYE